MVTERQRWTLSGWLALLCMLGLLGLALHGLFTMGRSHAPAPATVFLWLGVLLLDLFCLRGLMVLNPNEAMVLQFFGRYVGTVKANGLRWAVNPLYTKRRLSLRVRNFETGRLKVNDLEGNPIEVAAVVVWRVVDTAAASFNVESYGQFVHVQSEAALRNLVSRYSYDAHGDDQPSLRGNTAMIAEHLRKEIQERLAQAGVTVVDARISHLAYAPEIAQAMLQRQQAGAIIAARQRIVDGAVGMVEMALERLTRKGTVTLDEARKAALVSNLLVVLCSERGTHPIVNAGAPGGG